MNLTRRPALEFTAAQIAEAMNAGFEDYLLPVNFTPQATERRFRAEHLDPEASMVYRLDDRVAGVAPAGPGARAGVAPVGLGARGGIVMVSRRGWTARVAAMGVTKTARGQGIGKRMMQDVVRDARERGDRTLCLEVFEQNPNAVKLYRSVGFQITRRLVGYRRESEPGEAAHLSQIDPLAFSRIAMLEGEADLPWQLAAESFAGQVAPVQAYALEDTAFALIRDTPGDSFVLHALVVRRNARARGFGRRMVRGLTAMLGAKACAIVQIVPDDLAPGFFARAGFRLMPLNQFEMRLEL